MRINRPKGLEPRARMSRPDTVRGRQPGENAVGLDERVAHEPVRMQQGIKRDIVRFVPCRERRDEHAAVNGAQRRVRSSV